ncbi:MAG: hypothetical protein ACHQT8_02870 [Chlamydiales bacterium]
MFDLQIDLRVIRSRSTLDAILELVRKEKFDLIVLAAVKSPEQKGIGLLNARILREAPCRVWICTCDKKRHKTKD